MKKFIAALMTAAMFFTSFGTVYAADKEYLTENEVCDILLSAADDYNANVTEEDILQGYDLDENEYVTRAQALVMLKRAFGDIPELKGGKLFAASGLDSYSDVSKGENTELDAALSAGISAGTGNDNFSPNAYITKEQLDRFIQRTYSVFGTNKKDDFYYTINKDRLENATFPPGYTTVGGIYDIRVEMDQRLSDMLKEIASSEAEKGSDEEKIKTVYNNFLNFNARNEQGYEPIKLYLDELEAVSNMDELTDFVIKAYKETGFTDICFYPTVDTLDSTKYITYFDYPCANFDVSVYNGGNDKLKNAYLKYVSRLLELVGEDEASAEKKAQICFEAEKQYAESSLKPEEYYDHEKTYNIYSLQELDDIFTEIDLQKLFDCFDLKSSDRIQVPDKGLMYKNAELFKNENIDTVKTLLKVSMLQYFANYLSEDFTQASDEFTKESTGTDETVSTDVKAVEIVTSMLSDYVGKVYAKRYDSPEANADVKNIIEQIRDVYRQRIESLDWMSDTTKEKAIKKLNNIKVKVGSPEKWKDILAGFELKSFADGGSFFQNFTAVQRAGWKYILSREGTTVDNTEWISAPYIVNAFYNPTANDITITAAILADPIYSSDMSYEEKLGGVGYVCAHEMSHAFDSNGAQYDENGNVNDWWTKEDKEAFQKLCTDVVEFYRGSEWAPGILVNPELTLTENIADMGAASCLTAIGEKHENFDFKKMYESLARAWAISMTRETMLYYHEADPHSPSVLRINKVLQSVDKFYDVYNINPGDGMYIAKENRARIW
ncbi:MAG TPA: hypothetical protein DCG28_06800 [Lachnospiraceae bacterium]|nr:hypothetical protein [Lachnospiraceae bacterium]